MVNSETNLQIFVSFSRNNERCGVIKLCALQIIAEIIVANMKNCMTSKVNIGLKGFDLVHYFFYRFFSPSPSYIPERISISSFPGKRF